MQGLLNRRKLGSIGEVQAEAFLKGQGFRILERNFRTQWGELDLIVEEKTSRGPQIFFVEVKTRQSSEAVALTELISKTKQVHLSKAAQYYISKKGLEDVDADFAVVLVSFEEDRAQFELIKHAFPLAWGY